MAISFQDTLASFEEIDTTPLQEEEEEIHVEDVSPSINLHPDELETLKEEAYQRGLKDGQAKAESTFSEKMASSLKDITLCYEQSIEQKKQALTNIHKMMIDGVFNVVNLFLGPNLAQTELKKDLKDDFKKFSSLFNDQQVITCSKYEKEELEHLFKDNKKILINTSSEKERGDITLEVDGKISTFNQAEWINDVRNNIVKAAKAIRELKIKAN